MTRHRGELAIVLCASAALAALFLFPIVSHFTRAGRIDNADGQFAIWNVAWVARTLLTDPRHVFDANIFFPHRSTLSYSEANLVAGALGLPAYWLTHGNAFAAHNAALVLAFVLSATGMYYLVRRLTTDRRAAAVSAVCFAFCPYMFAHLPHIQLLMTFGLPFSMLAFHRLNERPGIVTGAVLGAVMTVQAIACGYYGVFDALMVGVAVLIAAAIGRRWSDVDYWLAVGTAASVAVVLVAPVYAPYVRLQRDLGFARPLEAADMFSAAWSTYLASSSYLHIWMLNYLPPWKEVAFPGFVAVVFALAAPGLWWRTRLRETLSIYGAIAALALWASFGPRAGLYAALYRTIPVFSLLRASQRFGIVVDFAICVLAGIVLAAVLARIRYATAVGVAIAIFAAIELLVPLNIPIADPPDAAYAVLARQPAGALIELPFYYPEVGLYQHAKYMLASTYHWKPIVNGYSDYIPPDFYDHALTLAAFPNRDGFKILEANHVRYAMFHMYGYNGENRHEILGRLADFHAYLRPVFANETTQLYEITGFPR